MLSIVILASGEGTNAEQIIRYLNEKNIEVRFHIFCNRADAGIIERSKRLGVACRVFNKTEYLSGEIASAIQLLQPDLIVLAGFLWLIPAEFVKLFKGKIINIHPALLPNYGGKGMYGIHVHEAVKKNNEKETGITIHWVNEHYDEGGFIFQARTEITDADSIEDISKKVRALELKWYPKIVEMLTTTEP